MLKILFANLYVWYYKIVLLFCIIILLLLFTLKDKFVLKWKYKPAAVLYTRRIVVDYFNYYAI